MCIELHSAAQCRRSLYICTCWLQRHVSIGHRNDKVAYQQSVQLTTQRTAPPMLQPSGCNCALHLLCESPLYMHGRRSTSFALPCSGRSSSVVALPTQPTCPQLFTTKQCYALHLPASSYDNMHAHQQRSALTNCILMYIIQQGSPQACRNKPLGSCQADHHGQQGTVHFSLTEVKLLIAVHSIQACCWHISCLARNTSHHAGQTWY